MVASSGVQAEPVLPYSVAELSIEDGLDIAMWKTPGPWAVEDSLEPPRADEGYWSVRDAQGALIGFCCFGGAARVPGLADSPTMLDVALGLRPDLTGHGLSRGFAAAVIDHARSIADGRSLRCVVAEGNRAGRRITEAVGFRLTGHHEVKGGAVITSYFVYQM